MAENQYAAIEISDTENSSDEDNQAEADHVDRAIDRAAEYQRRLKKVREAKSSLHKFMEKAADEEAVSNEKLAAVKRKLRVAVEAPKHGEPVKPAPIVTGKRLPDATPDPQLAFEVAACAIVDAVGKILVEDGYGEPVETFEEVGADSDEVNENVPADYPHEQDLERAILPETLRTALWPMREHFGRFDIPLSVFANPDESDQLRKTLQVLLDGIQKLHDKVDTVLRINNLHSAALVQVIQVCNQTRLLCVADAPAKDKAYKTLQASLGAIVLANDYQLKKIPFMTLTDIEVFFRYKKKIQKLVVYILNYVCYDRGFFHSILNVLLDAKLQRQMFWSTSEHNT